MRKTCSSRLSKKRKIKWKNKKVFHLPLERTGRLRLNCWKCSASSARVIDRNYIGERAGRNFPLFPSSNVAAAAYKYTLSLMASKYKAPSMRHLNSSSLKGEKWIPSRLEQNQKSRCLKDKKKATVPVWTVETKQNGDRSRKSVKGGRRNRGKKRKKVSRFRCRLPYSSCGDFPRRRACAPISAYFFLPLFLSLLGKSVGLPSGRLLEVHSAPEWALHVHVVPSSLFAHPSASKPVAQTAPHFIVTMRARLSLLTFLIPPPLIRIP